MCYSPEADIVAGVVVGAMAFDAYRHAGDDRASMALVAIPTVLAAHQVIEAFAWWGLQGRVPEVVGDVATGAYLAIAFTVVPVLVPWAVRRSEPVYGRRRSMTPFVWLGLLVAAVLASSLVTGPASAEIGGRYIAYAATVPAGGVVAGMYVVAVCTPLILSSHRRLAILGLVNIPVVIGLWLLLAAGFISLWCVWAAITSLIITVHVRRTNEATSAGGSSRGVLA